MSKVIPFEKSFASSDKAQYWSFEKEKGNGKVKPRDVFKNSKNKYWFNCDKCSHLFDSRLADVSRGGWCPYCSNKKLCEKEECKECLKKSFSSHEKAECWSIGKNKVKPRDIFKTAGSKFWFVCDCGHLFDSTLAHIKNDRWCPYCSNPPKKLCEKEDCKECFEKSFASHEKAKCWSIGKNKVKPRDIFKTAGSKFWFICDCGHLFDSTLASIKNGSWCPYCSNPPKKLCEKEDCKECFEKSFASSIKAKYWSFEKEKGNGTVVPRDVFKNSNDKYWFKCSVCSHCFDCVLSNVITGYWCPYCTNQKLCEVEEDCKICFEKSFASSDKAKYWINDKNGEVKPINVFKGSDKKYWFNCDKKHIFYSCVGGISRGTWCPFCINKTEQKVYEELIIHYPTLQQQYRVEWCKKKTYLPFDFVIPEHNIIIELDGSQHFIQISNWSSPEEQQMNDKYKMDCANKHNYSVIRILQADVFYDTYDWLEELNQNIKKIIDEKNVQNIYMCKNNEYDVFDNK
jgi:very-short-patch-repair endonuclease